MAENIFTKIASKANDVREEKLIEQIGKGKVDIDKLSDKQMTEKVCVALIEKGGCRLTEIPREKRTQAVCDAAIKKGREYWNFKNIPKESLTEEICIQGIKRHSLENIVDLIPLEKRTPAVCEAMFREYPTSSKDLLPSYFPEESMIGKVYEHVISKRREVGGRFFGKLKREECNYDIAMKNIDLTNDANYNDFLDAVKGVMHGKLDKLCEKAGVKSADELPEEHKKLFEGALEEVKKKIEEERQLQKETQKKYMEAQLKELSGEESQPNQ